MLFSIIIPVYNTKKYLRECIDSLKHQTLKDFEIIIVDDGSTDGSSSLCDNLPSLYPDLKFKIIHQENSGQIAARYKGIDNATGEYCLFLDSDDLFVPTAIQDLSCAINHNKSDIIIFEGQRFYQNKFEPFWSDLFTEEKIIEGKDYSNYLKQACFSSRFNNICFKAYRTEIIKSAHRYVDISYIRFEEDFLMQLPFWDACSSITYIPSAIYLYRYNTNSISFVKYNKNAFKSAKFINTERKKYACKWKLNNYKVQCADIFMLRIVDSIKQLKNATFISLTDKLRIIKEIRTDEDYKRDSSFYDGKIPTLVGKMILNTLNYRLYFLTLLIVDFDPHIHGVKFFSNKKK